MSFAKKSVCVFLCVMLAAAVFSTKAGAITLDGTIGTIEWKNAVKTEIFPSGDNTNSDIDYAHMRMQVDRNNNAVYLAFMVMQRTRDALKPGNTAIGVRLNIKSGVNITCRITGADEFDQTAYSVAKSIVIGSNNDYMIEMRIGYLFGVPENPLLGLQFIDSYGGFTNYYGLDAVTTAVSTTSVATTKVTTTAKPATTKPTTAGKQTTVSPPVNGTTPISGGSPENDGINPAVTGENDKFNQTDTTCLPNNTDDSGRPEDEETAENDTGAETRGIGIKKQIAAVAAAAILIGLAVYLCVIAAKRKPAPETGPEKQVDEPDKTEDDEDL